MDFGVVVREVGGTTVLAVRGELDAATAPQVEAAAPADASTGVVLDLSACSFLDSSGFRAVGLVARRPPGRTAVVSPPSVVAVRRVVDLLGLRALVPVHDDLASALASLADAAETA